MNIEINYNKMILTLWLLQALEGQHGSLLALAYIIGEIFRSQKINQEAGNSVLSNIDKPLQDSIVKAVMKIGELKLLFDKKKSQFNGKALKRNA